MKEHSNSCSKCDQIKVLEFQSTEFALFCRNIFLVLVGTFQWKDIVPISQLNIFITLMDGLHMHTVSVLHMNDATSYI